MDVTLRKEPGEAEIMTIVDANAAGVTRKTRKKHRRSSDMRGEARALDAGGESR